MDVETQASIRVSSFLTSDMLKDLLPLVFLVKQIY